MTPTEFKKIRKELGLTQGQLAAALGLNSGRAVRAYELGERSISGPIQVALGFIKEIKNDQTIRTQSATR